MNRINYAMFGAIILMASFAFASEVDSDSDERLPLTPLPVNRIPRFCFEPVPVPFHPCINPLPEVPRYFYDMFSGECRRLYRGGCGMTRNVFFSKEQCLATCKGVPYQPSPFPELIRPTRP